ncbi:hypothetical protein [Leptospira bandrabouensis]|uniref:Uncharacterized protein n=1 Tax=Leptospira bandrabouensis TaxID=2484903 RepID=A0A6H3NQS8_9LEPT|nr:hypothetical protein [Leptospira bandrabouensis]TGN11606.1 hypothetical protein EHR08_17080 [Leptospira bandrabouensis]
MRNEKYTSQQSRDIERNNLNESKFIELIENYSPEIEKKALIQFVKLLGFCTDTKQGLINKRVSKNQNGYVSFTPKNNNHLYALIQEHFETRKLKLPYDVLIRNLQTKKNIKFFGTYDNYIQKKTAHNLSLKESYNSNILCIDIDTHSMGYTTKYSLAKNKIATEDYYYSLFKYLYENLGSFPIFCQYSILGRGIYLYYKTDTIKSYEKEKLFTHIKELILKFDEIGIRKTKNQISGVEMRTSTHLNRLPLSFDYTAINNKFEPLLEFRNIFNHVAENLKESCLEYKIIQNSYTSEVYDDVDIAKILSEAYSDYEFESIWSREKKANIKLDDIFIPIVQGKKNSGLFTLATMWLLQSENQNPQSFYDLVYKCNQHDKASKDVSAMFRNSNGIIEIRIDGANYLDNIIKGAKENLEKNGYKLKTKPKKAPNQLINKITLSNDQKKILKLLVNQLKSSFCKHYPLSYLENTLYEILCKMQYEECNIRRVTKEIKFKKETKNNLSLGSQFPRIFQKLVKEKYKMKCDMTRMFNLIIKSNVFIQLMTTSRGYIPPIYGGSCRQFNLNTSLICTIKDINMFKNLVFNKLISKIIPIPQFFIICDLRNYKISETNGKLTPVMESS